MPKFPDAAGKVAKLFNVVSAVQAGSTLHKDVPLAYCLMLDPRTPLRPKAWFAAKVVLMVVDLPIPIAGEVDVFVAIRSFRAFVDSIERSKPQLVAEHRAALAAHTSIWDRHLAAGVDTGKAFGQAVAAAAGPVKGAVHRVAVPSADIARKVVNAPVRAVRWTADRIRGVA